MQGTCDLVYSLFNSDLNPGMQSQLVNYEKFDCEMCIPNLEDGLLISRNGSTTSGASVNLHPSLGPMSRDQTSTVSTDSNPDLTAGVSSWSTWAGPSVAMSPTNSLPTNQAHFAVAPGQAITVAGDTQYQELHAPNQGVFMMSGALQEAMPDMHMLQNTFGDLQLASPVQTTSPHRPAFFSPNSAFNFFTDNQPAVKNHEIPISNCGDSDDDASRTDLKPFEA